VDQQAMRAWRLFLVAHARLTAQLEEELREQAGMPLTWYDVLVQLSEAPEGRLRMQELARAVLLSKSGLTRLVDRLCAAGYLAREADPVDRRGTLAVLTPAGRRALREAAPVHLRGVERAFAEVLTEAEASTLAEAFARIVDRLGDDAPGGADRLECR
jgi:DNA-binding MarR family transcriptional regulator